MPALRKMSIAGHLTPDPTLTRTRTRTPTRTRTRTRTRTLILTLTLTLPLPLPLTRSIAGNDFMRDQRLKAEAEKELADTGVQIGSS